MSEAMSSVEIEDVLSSIRRLVSEDLRPGPRFVPSARADVVQMPKADEKLLLTPAFRVVAPAEPVAVEPAPAVQPMPLPRLHLEAEPIARVVASNLERAVEAHSTEWESEVGDPPLLVPDVEWTEDGWASTRTEPVVDAPANAAAEVVAFAPPEAEAPAWAQHEAEAPAWAQQEPEAPAWAQQEPEALDPEFPAEDGIAAPIAEPDSRWADLAEAEAVAELDGEEPLLLRETDGAQVEPGQELRLDEEVLRELVRELMLGELQGALGERITRNVRKLVRAEVARAISALNAQ